MQLGKRERENRQLELQANSKFIASLGPKDPSLLQMGDKSQVTGCLSLSLPDIANAVSWTLPGEGEPWSPEQSVSTL